MFVKLRAVVVQIFVRFIRISDTGVEIEDPLRSQGFLKGLVEFSSKASADRFAVQVDRHLAGAVVSRPILEDAGIRVSLDHSAALDHQIGVALLYMRDPAPEFLE